MDLLLITPPPPSPNRGLSEQHGGLFLQLFGTTKLTVPFWLRWISEQVVSFCMMLICRC